MFIFERENTLKNVYLFLREREGTEGLNRALCWHQRAPCVAGTHEPWDHDLSWSQCSTNWATPAPYLTFGILIVIYLVVDLFVIILFGTLWASWTWMSVSLPRLWKFLAIIYLSIISAPFSLSSPGAPNCKCYSS